MSRIYGVSILGKKINVREHFAHRHRNRNYPLQNGARRAPLAPQEPGRPGSYLSHGLGTDLCFRHSWRRVRRQTWTSQSGGTCTSLQVQCMFSMRERRWRDEAGVPSLL